MREASGSGNGEEGLHRPGLQGGTRRIVLMWFLGGVERGEEHDRKDISAPPHLLTPACRRGSHFALCDGSFPQPLSSTASQEEQDLLAARQRLGLDARAGPVLVLGKPIATHGHCLSADRPPGRGAAQSRPCCPSPSASGPMSDQGLLSGLIIRCPVWRRRQGPPSNPPG